VRKAGNPARRVHDRDFHLGTLTPEGSVVTRITGGDALSQIAFSDGKLYSPDPPGIQLHAILNAVFHIFSKKPFLAGFTPIGAFKVAL